MGKESELIRSLSEGAVAGVHPETEPPAFLIAPATKAEFNLVRTVLSPKGCFRMEDLLFEFDSSFVLPDVRKEMPPLFQLIDDHSITDLSTGEKQRPSLTIFGHADPTGNDEYNKFLSGRRAAAIYAMLTRRDEIWEDLFRNTGIVTPLAAGDQWGTKSLRTMREAVGLGNSSSQEKLREESDSTARKSLFRAYMDHCCVDPSGKPFQIDRVSGFLARNEAKDGKGDFQGCGEFNPTLLFAKQEKTRLDKKENKAERDARNQSNRRVMVLLFAPGTRVDPGKWPCPSVKAGTTACRNRFFSNGDERRSNLEEERRFEKTKDTFACRFYHRLAFDSPCEAVVKEGLSHISLLLRSNSGSVPVANRKYRIRINEKRILQGTTDEDGFVNHPLIPPGDYPMDVEGVTDEVIVPTLPVHLARRLTRVPGFFADPTHFAEVQVVDEKGKPISGVVVNLIKSNGSKDPRTTNTDGVARWDGLIPGDVRIEFTDTEHFPDEEPQEEKEPPEPEKTKSSASPPPSGGDGPEFAGDSGVQKNRAV